MQSWLIERHPLRLASHADAIQAQNKLNKIHRLGIFHCSWTTTANERAVVPLSLVPLFSVCVSAPPNTQTSLKIPPVITSAAVACQDARMRNLWKRGFNWPQSFLVKRNSRAVTDARITSPIYHIMAEYRHQRRETTSGPMTSFQFLRGKSWQAKNNWLYQIGNKKHGPSTVTSQEHKHS